MKARASKAGMAALVLSACWFPGNPLGYSTDHPPAPECPESYPTGKPCDKEKMQFCTRKSFTYECFDGEWHRG